MTNLTGSEKQIKWAEDIINSAYETIEINIERINSNIAPQAPELAEKENKAWGIIKDALDKAFETYTKAGDIINNRTDFSGDSIIRKHDMVMMQM